MKYIYKNSEYDLTELIELAKKMGKSLRDLDFSLDNGGDSLIPVFKKRPSQIKADFEKKMSGLETKVESQEREIAELRAQLAKDNKNQFDLGSVVSERKNVDDMNKSELVALAKERGVYENGMKINELRELLR